VTVRRIGGVIGLAAERFADLGLETFQITPAGMRAVFDPYELAGYLSSAKALLPWTLLRPYLRKAPAFDPARLEVPAE
jgi:hypothetical protein